MTFNIGDKVRIIDKGYYYESVGILRNILHDISVCSETEIRYIVEFYDSDHSEYETIIAHNIKLVNDPKKETKMINNLSIKIQRKVECDFSAAQWELYVNKFPRKEIEKIADDLNQRLQGFVNDSKVSKDRTRELMYTIMEGYSKYGAYDTEPRVPR